MRTRNRGKERRPLTDEAGFSRCFQNPDLRPQTNARLFRRRKLILSAIWKLQLRLVDEKLRSLTSTESPSRRSFWEAVFYKAEYDDISQRLVLLQA